MIDLQLCDRPGFRAADTGKFWQKYGEFRAVWALHGGQRFANTRKTATHSRQAGLKSNERLVRSHKVSILAASPAIVVLQNSPGAMKPLFFSLLLLLTGGSMSAIGFYQPGDTLYVWAVSGLTLRKEASLKATKLATIPYGTLVVAQNYSGDNKVEVEAVPGFTNAQGTFPPVTLKGSFAKVIFR
jgi:hypothetical protein